MANIMKVQNIKIRDALVNHDEGETVYCIDENKCFMWHDGKWIDMPGKVTGSHFVINYRQLMINTIKDFKPLNEQQLNRVRELTRNFVWKTPKAHYYALINFSEIRQPYFTLFAPKTNGEDVGQAVIECLQSRGEFIYMENYDPDEDIMLTYWIRTPEGTITECYLANYDEGVIEYA